MMAFTRGTEYLVNVVFLICPCAESQQQNRRGVALSVSTYHCLGAKSEGRNAGRGGEAKRDRD